MMKIEELDLVFSKTTNNVYIAKMNKKGDCATSKKDVTNVFIEESLSRILVTLVM